MKGYFTAQHTFCYIIVTMTMSPDLNFIQHLWDELDLITTASLMLLWLNGSSSLKSGSNIWWKTQNQKSEGCLSVYIFTTLTHTQHVHVGPIRVKFELQIWVPSGFVCSFHGGPTCVYPYGLQVGSDWISGVSQLGETHVGLICLPYGV